VSLIVREEVSVYEHGTERYVVYSFTPEPAMPPKFTRVSYQPDGSVSSEWIDEQEVEVRQGIILTVL